MQQSRLRVDLQLLPITRSIPASCGSACSHARSMRSAFVLGLGHRCVARLCHETVHALGSTFSNEDASRHPPRPFSEERASMSFARRRPPFIDFHSFPPYSIL